MAGYVPNDFRAILMEGLAGRTAVPTATLYLGLATAIPANVLTSTLANITEVATAGYGRAAVGTWAAATTTAQGLVQVTNNAQFTFPSLTADMTTAARWAFLTAAATGTASPIRYIFELVEPIKALTGEPLVVPVNNLILE